MNLRGNIDKLEVGRLAWHPSRDRSKQRRASELAQFIHQWSRISEHGSSGRDRAHTVLAITGQKHSCTSWYPGHQPESDPSDCRHQCCACENVSEIPLWINGQPLSHEYDWACKSLSVEAAAWRHLVLEEGQRHKDGEGRAAAFLDMTKYFEEVQLGHV